MKFRHKLTKWLNDGGRETLEFFFWFLSLITALLLCSFIATLLKHIPTVISEIVNQALEAAQ